MHLIKMRARALSSSRAVRSRCFSSQALLSPMTNLSSLRTTPPMHIVRGKGCKVYDANGKEYIEGIAGLWCTSLGWGNEELVEVAAAQMRELSYYHGFTGRRVPIVEELAETLIARAPEKSGLRDGGRVFFGMSGSDANDTQCRLLWHYFHALGMPKKRKIISRKRGYHGVTVASGSLTGLPYVHTQQGLPLEFVPRHVTCPSFYREGLPGETEAEFVQRLAAELDAAIAEEGGADEVAALIMEPLQGAGGVVLPPSGYFEAVEAVCKQHGVLTIGDEVITGLGRTGKFWGADAFGQSPDLVSSAKQLTSAYLPLSAVLLPGQMYEAMEEYTRASGGVFGHGFTYSSHPVSCAVALKVIEIMDRERLVESVDEVLGPRFNARLNALADHPLVGEARGIGLIGAIELVADKATRELFQPGLAGKVVARCLEHGLITRPLAADSVIALCPPLVISPAEIDDMYDRLELALNEVMAEM